jgi:nicotinamide mononucleotide transporter
VQDWVSAIALIEVGGVVFAAAYLLLAIKQSVWCWPAAIVSVGLSFVLFFDASLYMEAWLQIFYFGMALYGWQQWLKGGAGQGVALKWWTPGQHGLAIAVIFVCTAAAGWLLRGTDQALPYLDSFTTVAAIVATFMVARKVIENWIYWSVIDSVSIYLYLSRGLELYALLFVAYLVMIVFGWRAWRADWRAANGRA